jgi:hypothetical protein
MKPGNRQFFAQGAKSSRRLFLRDERSDEKPLSLKGAFISDNGFERGNFYAN